MQPLGDFETGTVRIFSRNSTHAQSFYFKISLVDDARWSAGNGVKVTVNTARMSLGMILGSMPLDKTRVYCKINNSPPSKLLLQEKFT
jgi:hypothetical protein